MHGDLAARLVGEPARHGHAIALDHHVEIADPRPGLAGEGIAHHAPDGKGPAPLLLGEPRDPAKEAVGLRVEQGGQARQPATAPVRRGPMAPVAATAPTSDVPSRTSTSGAPPASSRRTAISPVRASTTGTTRATRRAGTSPETQPDRAAQVVAQDDSRLGRGHGAGRPRRGAWRVPVRSRRLARGGSAPSCVLIRSLATTPTFG